MGGETGHAPEIIGFDMVPVAAADVDPVTVIGEEFAEEGIAHHDIAAGLEISVAREAFAHLFEPPFTPLVTGSFMTAVFHAAVFERIAPEVMFDGFEPEFGDEDIKGMCHIFADLREADIQRLGFFYAVIVINKPFGMLFVYRRMDGTKPADPDGRTETEFADLVGVMPHAVRKFFKIDAVVFFINAAETMGRRDELGIPVVDLDPADSGEILFQEGGFLQQHGFADVAENAVVP